MTQQLITAAKALLAYATANKSSIPWDMKPLFEALRAAVEAAEKQPVQEPVAWTWKDLNSGGSIYDAIGFKRPFGVPHEETKPLYAAPVAQQEAKPLSEERIVNEFNRTCYVPMKFADGTEGIALDRQAAIDFARAIEAAHGIGVKP